MSKYVDCFIVPVPKDKFNEYEELAKLSAEVWREHGALEYVECVADDAPFGEQTSFPRSVNLSDDEIVVVSYIIYKSREHRDEVNQKCMEDRRLSYMSDLKVLPFDSKRMVWGGFKSFIE